MPKIKIDLKKWWAYFGVTIFILISLSFIEPVFLYIEVLAYFVGCGLAIVTLVKFIKTTLSPRKDQSIRSLKDAFSHTDPKRATRSEKLEEEVKRLE